jgi:hypothetical protein
LIYLAGRRFEKSQPNSPGLLSACDARYRNGYTNPLTLARLFSCTWRSSERRPLSRLVVDSLAVPLDLTFEPRRQRIQLALLAFADSKVLTLRTPACIARHAARTGSHVSAARCRFRQVKDIRIGLATDVGKCLYDCLSSTKRKRTRHHFRRKNTSFCQIRLYTHYLSKEFARTVGLMRFNHNRTSVIQNNASDTADARLVEQASHNRGAKISLTERIEESRDGISIGAFKNGQFDKRKRWLPFAQMRGDDWGKVINYAVHV